MYDFKHQNDLNAYETYTQTVKKEDSLNKVRNILFYILILLFIFMSGMFFLNNYQNEIYIKENSSQVLINSEISHLELTRAITQSVVKNLQSQRTLQAINDDELKSIIQKVVNKIETKPSQTKYSQK